MSVKTTEERVSRPLTLSLASWLFGNGQQDTTNVCERYERGWGERVCGILECTGRGKELEIELAIGVFHFLSQTGKGGLHIWPTASPLKFQWPLLQHSIPDGRHHWQ